MPVTIAWSEKVYEKLGHDVAAELAEWLNRMDAQSRSDLRELNDLNFARFEARLQQGLSDLRSELLRWMFVYWAGSVVTTVGLVLTVVVILRP